MRIASGVSDQYIYFAALDESRAPLVGYQGKMVVKRSRNGGALATYTTPTINQTDTGGGGYELLVDEDTTIDAGDFTQEYYVRIKDTGGHMVPIRRTIELFRPGDTGGIADAVYAKGINDTGVYALVDRFDTGVNSRINQFDTGINSRTAQLSNKVDTGVPSSVWDEILSGATHNIATSAGRRLRNIQDFGIYDLAAVWVDEVNGASTGTTDGEDATVANRADDFDNAQTVADSVGLTDIRVTNGNTITLSAALEGYNLWGNGSSLALGSQNLGGTVVREFASVTGIATSTANPIYFENCIFGNVTLPPSILQQCGMGGTLTLGSAGNFDLVDCYSIVPGANTPVIDMGAAVGATNLSIRRWSGGLTLNNVATGDVVSVDCVSGGTVTINGTGGTVHVRGMVKVVDGSGGAVSITQTQVVNDDNIADSVWDEEDTGHADTGTFGRLRQGSTTVDFETGLLDLSNGVETGLTVRQALRLISSILGGKVSGAGTSTEVFRNAVADDTDRVTATVDPSGNRVTITLDLS